MKSLEAYKKAFKIRVFALILGATIFIITGLILIIIVIRTGDNPNGWALGGFFILIGIIFFALLPAIIKNGKKTIQKDEAELEYLRNGGKGNDNKF